MFYRWVTIKGDDGHKKINITSIYEVNLTSITIFAKYYDVFGLLSIDRYLFLYASGRVIKSDDKITAPHGL